MQTVDSWIALDKNYDDEIVELDELKVTKITPKLKDELEKYKALKRLSMIACDLRSLDNFPNLTSLEELELADNKIKGDELSKLPSLNNLRRLGLSSNLINGVQDLKSLTKFNKIIQRLTLDECPLTKNNNYRQQVFQLIGGSLQVIDAQDREGKEVAEQSQIDQEQDEDDDDDVEGELIQDDDDDDEQPLPGKRKGPQRGSGKQQSDDDDDDDEDDEQGDEEDSEGYYEEDSEEQEQQEGPKKKAKRS